MQGYCNQLYSGFPKKKKGVRQKAPLPPLQVLRICLKPQNYTYCGLLHLQLLSGDSEMSEEVGHPLSVIARTHVPFSQVDLSPSSEDEGSADDIEEQMVRRAMAESLRNPDQ